MLAAQAYLHQKLQYACRNFADDVGKHESSASTHLLPAQALFQEGFKGMSLSVRCRCLWPGVRFLAVGAVRLLVSNGCRRIQKPGLESAILATGRVPELRPHKFRAGAKTYRLDEAASGSFYFSSAAGI